MSEKRDFSNPHDNVFDRFFARGWDEEALPSGKTRPVNEYLDSASNLSWARKRSGDFKFQGESEKNAVYGAYRFIYSKDKDGLIIPEDTLAKVIRLLEMYGYTVIETE